MSTPIAIGAASLNSPSVRTPLGLLHTRNSIQVKKLHYTRATKRTGNLSWNALKMAVATAAPHINSRAYGMYTRAHSQGTMRVLPQYISSKCFAEL
jgi:hypothetical protein